jgi:hypothetical protein
MVFSGVRAAILRGAQESARTSDDGICVEMPSLILPDGQIREVCVQPHLQKYFCFHSTQITCLLTPSRAHQEGRFAIVTDVGCGERWTRELRLTSVAEADGEVVWS